MELEPDDPHPILKDQVVIVGGHLDSWIFGTGAIDNGAGSMVATRPHYS
jgi:Zn-dependent M28 family amino/carboxypeptidase